MKGEEVYAALTRRDFQKVRELCSRRRKGNPFLKLTKRRQSVLQKALYSTQVDLVLKLLEDAEERWNRRVFERKLVMDVTANEDTLIHVAATHDDCIPAVKKIFEWTTQLLFYSNIKGESPIFNAVRYGQLKMFDFLNREYIKAFPDEEDRLSMYRATDESSSKGKYYNILHVAIYNEHFELALYIATTIPSLIRQKDYNKLTGLHLLAMNPSAFETRGWKYLEFLFSCPFPRLSDKILREEAKDDDSKKAMKAMKEAADEEIFRRDARDGKWKDAAGKMTIPWWNRKTNAYRRYRAAVLLGSFLVKKDTSWLHKLVVHDPNSDKVDDDDDDEDDADYDDDDDEDDADYDDDDEDDADYDKPKDYKDDDHNNEDVNIVRDPGGVTQTNPAVSMEPEKPPTPAVSMEPEKPPTPAVSKKPEKPPSPLVLATKFGCLEIALDIIRKHPHAVEQAGHEGSVLHLAIRYRRKKIMEAVLKMRMQMRMLVRLKDDQGNSILHMVALNTPKAKVKNGTDATSTHKPKANPLHSWEAEVPIHETRSPAFELQKDLLLFEHVEKILKANYHKNSNKDLQTPDQLFAERKERLRDSSQEYMKRTSENCSLVAVLIATVAFAAAYTVPGGTDDKNGSPLLLKETFFVVFTIADVLSLAFTLTAVVIFLSILSSPFRFEDFKETLPKRLMYGIGCLLFSLAMMMLAFAATIILMIKNKQQWTKIALYAVAFLPVTVLIATLMPFVEPLRRTYRYTKEKAEELLPKCNSGIFRTSITKKRTPSPELEQGSQCSCLHV